MYVHSVYVHFKMTASILQMNASILKKNAFILINNISNLKNKTSIFIVQDCV